MEHQSNTPYQEIDEENVTYVVYKRRWFVLLTLSTMNFSNSLSLMTWSPVAYTAAEFYGQDIFVLNVVTSAMMIFAIPCGIVASWLLDTYGLRLSLILSAWLNFIGSLLCVISALPLISDGSRAPLMYIGSIVISLAMPFVLSAPTKLSALWFPQNQRATANTIVLICNAIGIMAAGILSPILAPTKDRIPFMLYVESAPSVLAVLMTTFGVWSSRPPTPPSASAGEPSEPFLVGFKALLKNKPYWLLAFTVGGQVGYLNAFMSLLPQILCPWGYDAKFAGIVCLSSLLGAGLIGGLCVGVIADKTRNYLEVIKICYVMSVLALVAFSVMESIHGISVPIAISLGVFGFFGSPVYPIGNELAVETTYPVGEGTSTGIILMISEIQAFLMVLILSGLGRKLPADFSGSACTSDSNEDIVDMTVPMYVLSGYAVLIMSAFVLGFRTRYRRLEIEENKEREEEDVLVNDEPSSSKICLSSSSSDTYTNIA